jgi:hypothetical protein
VFANRSSDNRRARPAIASGYHVPPAHIADQSGSSVGDNRSGAAVGIPACCKCAAEVGTGKVEKYVGNRGSGRSGSMRFLRNPEGSTLRTPKNKAGQFCLVITLREAFQCWRPAISVRGIPLSNLCPTLQRNQITSGDLEAGCRVLTASPPMGTTEPGAAGAARTVQTGAVSRRPRQVSCIYIYYVL